MREGSLISARAAGSNGTEGLRIADDVWIGNAILSAMQSRHAVVLVASLLAGCTAVAPASVSPSVQPLPSEVPATPERVVEHDEMDTAYLMPSAALEHDGVQHLWPVAFSEDSGAPPRVFHLQSTDGRSWTGDPAASLLDGAVLGLNGIGPIPSSVLVEPDGTWRLFGGGRLSGSDQAVVWTATASQPEGPWTMFDEPILRPERGSWDNFIADHPSVVRTDDGYLMAYGGAGSAAPNRHRIGMARSSDGLDWERFSVTLSDADDGDAMGPAGCGIDARTMFEPELRRVDDGFRLHFGVMTLDADEMVIGSASSADGLTWTCDATQPVLEPADFAGRPRLHSYTELAVDGRSHLLVEVLDAASSSSDIWLVASGD